MKILLIDDDKALTTMLKLELEEKKFEVEIAYDGESGKKIALKKKFDLIILDVMLPRINGYELCKNLRYEIDTPVLIITSLNMLEDRLTGVNSGADDFLVKPFSISNLLSRINSLIDHVNN